jgi:hypothetical protein
VLLLVDELPREQLPALLEQDSEVLAWWGTPVEMVSALARREREGLLTADEVAAALIAADHDPTSLEIVCLDERLRAAARREGFTVLGT